MSTYKVNGTDLLLIPETGKWVARDSIEFNGNGRPVYPAFREFEMHWPVMTYEEFDQIQGFYESIGVSGTASAVLPQYGATTGSYATYTGCQLQEPSTGPFFVDHYIDVTWRIHKIRVS